MAPFKRHPGQRVTAVAAVSALVVLGSRAPAFAAAPTISSFSPTSGPTGCVVVIRGTNFDNPIVTSVDIGGTQVSAFRIVSGTEIWATVAGDASGTIHVTNASNTASSGRDFTNANPGGCSPTILFLSLCSGSGGEMVTIIGTNLLKDSGTATSASVGGDVRFAPYADTAPHTGTPETPTRLDVVVPTNVADGAVRVSTFNDIIGEGAVLDAFFNVPPPDDLCAVPLSRRVTLRLTGSLVAQGMVKGSDEFQACTARVPVKIKRRFGGKRKTVAITSTSRTGSYKTRIPDRPGRYQAFAPLIVLDGVVPCPRATSFIRTRS